MMRRLLSIALIGASPVLAQQDRDPGFLAGLIEDSISAPGLSVQIDGFRGALSSEASIEELRIADDAGTWLVARDLVLDWNRSALFNGRLEVEALTAQLIRVERAPLPPEGVEPPPAAASGFSPPNLPVAIEIGRIAATRIDLGEPILGQATSLKLEASALLVDGSAETQIAATRIDGTVGTFSIAAAYTAGETPSLSIDLDLREAQGGLVATLLDLPGAPAMDLIVQGDGPLDNFNADIRLASDNVDRLSGQVTLTGVADGRAFEADISGDVTPLFAPEYRPFFGDSVAFLARGAQRTDGSLALDQLTIETRALEVGGQARIGPDGWPVLLDLEGQIASQDGEPVLLPTTDPITVGGGRFGLNHDASISEDWSLDLSLRDLNHPTLVLENGRLRGAGVLSRDGSTVTAADADLQGDLRGMAFSDPNLTQAIGPQASLRAALKWQDGAPVDLSDLQIEGAGLQLSGAARLFDGTAPDSGLPITFDLSLAANDIARFTGIAGIDLTGAADLGAQGAIDPLAGTFDLRLDGTAQELGLGIAQVDPLLDGSTTLEVATRRSREGTFLDTLSLKNAQLSLAGTATIYGEESTARADGETGEAQFDARLTDGRPIDPRLAGPITLNSTLQQTQSGVWSGTVSGRAPQGVSLDAEGVLTGPTPDLTFDLLVPDVSAFTEGVPGVAQLQGRASARDQIWSLDAQADLPWDLTAQVNGPVTGPAPRLTFQAALPDLTGPVPALATVPPLATGVNLQGTLSQTDGLWVINAQTQTGTGIEARVSGPVTGRPDITFTARVPEVEAFSPVLDDRPPLNGAATVAGTIQQSETSWRIDTTLETDGGVAATATGPVTGEAPQVDFTVDLPDLTGLDPALSSFDPLKGRTEVTGIARQAGGTWSVDASLAAPSEITARVVGDVTGTAAPDLAIAVTVPDVQVFVPAAQGTLSLDATLRQRPEGLTLLARATGPQDARATVNAALTDALVADFTLAAPQLAPLAPVPGGLDVTGQARQVEGGFNVDLSGTGPYAARFEAALSTVGGLSVDTQGQIPDARTIGPQLRGPIDFDVTAAQVDENWTVDATVDGAQAVSGRVQGVATGPEADLSVQARIGSVAPFAPGLSGALDLSGRLEAQGDGYGFDLQAGGPLGADLTASGTIADGVPSAQFNLNVPDIGPLVPDLSGPLRATGTARQQGDVAAVDVDLTGPGGTTASVTGTAGTVLNLGITGQAPLGLANAFISPNRISGQASFDLQANGVPGLDALSGTITTTGAALTLPALRNGLTEIGATIRLGGSQAQIDLDATPTSGGVLSVNGPVVLTAPFSSNLAIRFDGRLEDPTLYTARIITDLRFAGPLAGGASVQGDILLDEAEISVPSSGLTAVGALPSIRHVGASAPVERTLERAGQTGSAADGRTNGGRQAGPAFPLDLTVRAPNRIFVRGRGLDAELGGQISVGGTSADPRVTGGFELVRGRLDILQQRFQLDEGSITFQGSLIPFISLTAETETEALSAAIVVEGPATTPEVRFESSPSVPQEEILAQIFFGRDLASLSALQALQLANSVATLAGRGNGGLLERLRGNAGLDDLDLTTDAEGNTAIRAGKYISDNVYTDVQIGSDGNPKVTLNIDVTPSLTVRGGAGASGDTSIGLFFERDY